MNISRISMSVVSSNFYLEFKNRFEIFKFILEETQHFTAVKKVISNIRKVITKEIISKEK